MQVETYENIEHKVKTRIQRKKKVIKKKSEISDM